MKVRNQRTPIGCIILSFTFPLSTQIAFAETARAPLASTEQLAHCEQALQL
jgi:hypothetical protein